MKQLIHSVLLIFVFIQLASCQNREDKMATYFQWEEGTNAPLGYPAEVYKGGLELPNDGYVALYNGTIDGSSGWGGLGTGSSNGVKPLPNRLNVIYLSYAENQFYQIDCDIDYDKLINVFKQPLQFRNAYDNLMPDKFNRILVGFAPGGVAVVWASGPGTIIEIGRYQGKKVTIPESETMYLDASAHLIFEKEWVDKKMKNEAIIPIAVQEANKNKPIPFGLWDTYRIRYDWMPVFQIQNEGTLGDFGFSYFNGEQDDFYFENNQRNANDSEIFYQKSQFNKLPIPKDIRITWFDKENNKYAGYFEFNEEEIFKAFDYLIGENEQVKIEMVIRTNISNSYATVVLRASNGKEIAINQHNKDRFFKVKPRK